MGKKKWGAFPRQNKSEILSEYSRQGDREWSGNSLFLQEQFRGQADTLIRIERFVEKVISSTGPAYQLVQDRTGRAEPFETPLGRRLKEILPYVGMFGSYHQYSEHPLAFLDACWMMSSVYGVDLARSATGSSPLDLRWAEVMNAIVERIRMSAREPWFRRATSDRRYEAAYRASVMATYTADILHYYARTLIVRVDVGYRKEARFFLTIDQVYQHLDHLLYLKDSSPIFEGLVGYAWSVEQGERDGFHFHLVFYFDGSKVCRDVYKGFEIGHLWQEVITNGMGTFENCNARKERYGNRLGIGMIHRCFPEECANAIRCLQYLGKGGEFLSKDDQFLRIRPVGRRAFNAGHAPDEAQKRGRPALMHAY